MSPILLLIIQNTTIYQPGLDAGEESVMSIKLEELKQSIMDIAANILNIGITVIVYALISWPFVQILNFMASDHCHQTVCNCTRK